MLLQDSDTASTGRASVRNRSGSAELAAERDAALVRANRSPRVGTLSEPDVTQIFGDALSALPPVPRHFTLYFLFESDELTDESRALLPEIQNTVKERSVPEVVVVLVDRVLDPRLERDPPFAALERCLQSVQSRGFERGRHSLEPHGCTCLHALSVATLGWASL